MMSYLPSIKKARRYLSWIGRNEIFKNSATKFPTFCLFTFKRDISMTVASNHMRSEPMETRHQYLSRDTKFEEIQALKDLQTASQK